MSKPRLLDLFCGAGGAGMGYWRAGFDVVGVDIEPQPHYPFEFYRWDALEALAEMLAAGEVFNRLDFAAIHASPPCQAFTAYRRKGHGVGDGYPDLIAPTHAALEATGLPWVMENVPGSSVLPLVQLCGSSFGLDIRRHRWFETNVPMLSPPCAHGYQRPRFKQATNRTNPRRTVEVGVWRIPLDVQQRAMGIDWMTLDELSQAIPPAYTEYIGRHLLESLERAV